MLTRTPIPVLLLASSLSLTLACFEDTPSPQATSGEDATDSDASEEESTSTDDEVGTDTESESSESESTESESESTESESTETAVDPECGNAVVEDGEACDDGPEPPLAGGACKPDCSGVIETRRVILGDNMGNGNLGPNPVATADALCPVGYEAMFADGVSRRATTAPWSSVDSIDWPIDPYTRYVNGVDEEVWVTDDVALLGVRDGGHVDLTTQIADGGGCNPICTSRAMVTGLKADGTTLTSSNCDGWTQAAPNLDASRGSLVTGEYATGTTECGFNIDLIVDFYYAPCVEI